MALTKVSQGMLTPSVVVQTVNSQTGAVATGTTQIPVDDTIPQNTEGTQFLSLSITPTSATNELYIRVVLFFNINASTHGSIALFQDSTANALAADSTTCAANEYRTLTLNHKMTAGTTSATTFKVRAGPHGANTMTVNGAGAARVFGGVAASSITITETKA